MKKFAYTIMIGLWCINLLMMIHVGNLTMALVSIFFILSGLALMNHKEQTK